MKYQVGQIIRNKRNKLIRRITKVTKEGIHWITKTGRKGKCTIQSLERWASGEENR